VNDEFKLVSIHGPYETHFVDEPDKSLTLKNDPGLKWDKKKLRMDLIPVEALERIAEVLTYGAGRYGDWNWSRGISWSRTYAAALRHLLAWFRGEDLDPESGLSHLAHCACNLIFLLQFSKTKKEFDDRNCL
jgi:hypothetical protein